MNKDELFAAAKADIFGPEPECPMAMVGRNVAKSYFEKLIEDAEAVMLDMRVPNIGFDVMLRNAFKFDRDLAIGAFPDEAKAAIVACNDNFRSRYAKLLKQLTP